MKRVYIAGPLTHGDVGENIHNAQVAFHQLLEAGYEPYLPHATFGLHVFKPQPYERWMKLDFAYLAVCDVLIRLPGESPGADREVAFAQAHGIPVYDSVMDFAKAQGKCRA